MLPVPPGSATVAARMATEWSAGFSSPHRKTELSSLASRAWIAVVAAVVPLMVAGMPVTAAARTRIRCHDGVLGATVVARGKTPQQDDQSCDVDQTRDGKCMFDFVL